MQSILKPRGFSSRVQFIFVAFVTAVSTRNDAWCTQTESKLESNHNNFSSETSFAAAHASGVATLLHSINPELSVTRMRTILLQLARDLESPNWNAQFVYGLFDEA